MSYRIDVADPESATSRLIEATVVGVHADGSVVVAAPPGRETLTCAVPATAQVPVRVHVGDTVVVAQLANSDRNVLLGIIASRSRPASDEPADGTAECPDELVLEARKSLTLRVGEGSITIREDGRILIRGRDLVSQAKGRNRIRGGSVEIN